MRLNFSQEINFERGKGHDPAKVFKNLNNQHSFVSSQSTIVGINCKRTIVCVESDPALRQNGQHTLVGEIQGHWHLAPSFQNKDAQTTVNDVHSIEAFW